MKILISHVYSNDNKGDAALLSVLISDIRRAFKDPEITILTLDHIKSSETFEGVPVRNSFRYFARERYSNPVARAVYASYVAVSTLLWAFLYRYLGINLPIQKNLINIIELYRDADIIIPVGGGYICGKSGFSATVILFFIIHPLLLSRMLSKTTINYTQSIGPFGNWLQEFMARIALKGVDGIIVREDISFRILKEWNITKNVFASTDSGFSFVSTCKKNTLEGLNIKKGKLLVGFTVRSWMDKTSQQNYEKIMAFLADYVIEKYGAYVIFIPQVTVEHHNDDDRVSSKKVYEMMKYQGNAHVITERYDHNEIKSIYDRLDYLVGTRFHSVIFALTSFVPSIAVEYEHKSRGIMRDLGLEDWGVDIESIETDRLITLFDKLVQSRIDYIEHLKKVLPAYIDRANKSIYFVREIYESKITNDMNKITKKIQFSAGKVRASVLIVGLVVIIFFIAMSSITIENGVGPAYSGTTTTPALSNTNDIPPNTIPDDVSPPKSLGDTGHAVGIAAGSGLSKSSLTDINYQLDQMVKAGITWVRFDIEWGLVQYSSPDKSDWSSYDKLIGALDAHHIKALGILVFTPEWARDPKCSGGAKCPPKDPNQFATFAAEAAARYRDSGMYYWEIWNEPNSYNFWATKADCVAYTALLKATYPAIKKADPYAVIITGGVAPANTDNNNISPLDFLSCIYKNGGKAYFDAVGDHPYTFPSLPSSNSTNNWAQMSLTNPSFRSIMTANGDGDKKIWITEFGTPTNGPDPHWFTTESKQAEMVADTLAQYKKYDWVGPLFWYTIKDNGTSKDTSENFFGLMRADSTFKPAYWTMQSSISSGI